MKIDADLIMKIIKYVLDIILSGVSKSEAVKQASIKFNVPENEIKKLL